MYGLNFDNGRKNEHTGLEELMEYDCDDVGISDQEELNLPAHYTMTNEELVKHRKKKR